MKLMKKPLLFLVTAFFTLNSNSQISFEQGYFVNNIDEKIDCLIKNVDWQNNPTQFEYKLSNNSKSERITIESVKEFAIHNSSKYVRGKVNIDRSSEDISNLGYDRNPIFNEEVLFLKLLVEGKANLYQYKNGSLTRFFYNLENLSIEQLIYKSYETQNRKIAKNNRFKNQLWNDLKCPTFSIETVENLDYKKNDLIDFFIKYNECNDEKYINYEEQQKSERDWFNLNLRPGLNSSSLSISNANPSTRNRDFGNELAFRFGIEAEFIMPFNKNKWALIIEPTYHYFKSETGSTTGNAEVDYKSIELPMGIRHYFFLNKNSKLFVNGTFIIDVSYDSNIDFGSSSVLDIKTSNNLAVGFGYKYNDKYSLEFRYHTPREVLDNFIAWSSEYQTFSVILGYSIF